MQLKLLTAIAIVALGAVAKADTPPPGVPATITVTLDGNGYLSGSHTLTWTNDDNSTGGPGWTTMDPNEGSELDVADLSNGNFLTDLSNGDVVFTGWDATGDYWSRGDQVDFSGTVSGLITNSTLSGLQITNFSANDDSTNATDPTYTDASVGEVSVPETGALAGTLPLIGLLYRPTRKASHRQHSRTLQDSTSPRCSEWS